MSHNIASKRQCHTLKTSHAKNLPIFNCTFCDCYVLYHFTKCGIYILTRILAFCDSYVVCCTVMLCSNTMKVNHRSKYSLQKSNNRRFLTQEQGRWKSETGLTKKHLIQTDDRNYVWLKSIFIEAAAGSKKTVQNAWFTDFFRETVKDYTSGAFPQV